jgi:outer membrane protein insertion porin family
VVLAAAPAAAQPEPTEPTPAAPEANPASPETPPPPPAPPPPATPERSPLPAVSPGDDGETGDQSSLKYTLDDIEVRGNDKTRARVVLRYVPFRPGDIIDVDDPHVELTRYRLLGTGFFREVELSLRKGKGRGHVVLIIEVVERNTLVVNDLWMGLSAEGGTSSQKRTLAAYAGLDVAETNLAGTGITLGTAVGLAQDPLQVALRVRFFDPAFLGTKWMTNGTLLYNHATDFFGNEHVLFDDRTPVSTPQRFAAVDYQRFGGSLGVGRDFSVSTQLWAHYRIERVNADVPLAASHVRGTGGAASTEPIDFSIVRGPSVLSTIGATLQHDTRDKPFLTTHGWFASVTTEVSLSPFGSDYPYSRIDVLASRWWALPSQHVIRLHLFGGAISGRAPFFERYYLGDLSEFRASRVLGLNVERRSAPNFFGTDVGEIRYGDYAGKVDVEYRIPLYRGSRSVFGIDLFARAGLFAIAGQRDITHPPGGYSGAALIPIDFTANLGVQMDTSAGGFTFALANVIGFLPTLGGGK